MGILHDVDADEAGKMSERCEHCGKEFHETSFMRDEEDNAVSLFSCGTRNCPGSHPHTLPTSAKAEES